MASSTPSSSTTMVPRTDMLSTFITSIVGLYRSSYTGSPVKAPLCPLKVYKLLLETIATELARANAIRSNKWHVYHALSPLPSPGPPRSRMYAFISRPSRLYTGAQQQPGHRYGRTHRPSRRVRVRTLRLRSPGESIARPQAQRARTARCAATIAAPQVDSPQLLSQALEAQTGAPDRLARPLTVPPGAHSSSSVSVHAPVRTSKPRPATRARRRRGPARTRAQGEHDDAHRERGGAHSEFPAALAARG